MDRWKPSKVGLARRLVDARGRGGLGPLYYSENIICISTVKCLLFVIVFVKYTFLRFEFKFS